MDGLLNTMKPRSWLLLLLVILMLMATASANRRRSSSRREECPGFPGFRVNGVQPLAQVRGHVALVALLTSNCPFCIRQSEMLQELYEELQGNGSDVHMMIINGGPRPRPGRDGVFEQRVTFPVYHDDNERTIFSRVFRGSKDDIFIVDRCGLRAYKIPFPYSYLRYNYVRRALNRALQGMACPNCPAGPSDLQNMMMGDAPTMMGGSGRMTRPGRFNFGRNSRGPLGAFGGRRRGRRRRGRRHRGVNRSRCPRNDELCSEMRRAGRMYNRYRNQHNIQLHSGMREEEILGIFERSQSRGRSMGPVF